ncbi:MAG: hypothetical protein M0P91_11515 [Sulfuricurvum sp.]|uniref:hypothetical protein n=1 Tax=Sulfuricurvum sp. TaxID=2025608 RepID=UPI0025CD5193|nr:hypothetical protein [Sulfuricurvum sp.]MCK9373814.1 hypothetical protein [Sulfuricurvum sp.]
MKKILVCSALCIAAFGAEATSLTKQSEPPSKKEKLSPPPKGASKTIEASKTEQSEVKFKFQSYPRGNIATH